MKLAAVLVLASLVPLASGCIAAVVPLAAGAALVKTQTGREPARTSAEPAATAAARSDYKLVATSLTALPPPDAPMTLGNSAIPAFRTYALAQAEPEVGAGKRVSAIVRKASELRPSRTQCGPSPAAVFVDLDPGRGTFDPLTPGDADPALGAALAALRERGVRIVWFSRLGSNFAAAARAALVAGGLDPAGEDELMLMSDIGERKQTLRDEVAGRCCPIAIVGDERADFDELYLYLKDPVAAIMLDAMIGKGWFLASPFAPRTAANAGATP